MEKILVLNSGSTTVKFQLFEMEQGFHRVLAKGMVDRIGLPGSKIVVRADNGYEFSCECPVTDHKDAIKAILDYLSHRFLKNAAELSAVGHRMGHGGEYFDRSVIIDDDVMAKIYDTLPLLPLHGPAFVHGVEAMTELLPGVCRWQRLTALSIKAWKSLRLLMPFLANIMKRNVSAVTVFTARRTITPRKKRRNCLGVRGALSAATSAAARP